MLGPFCRIGGEWTNRDVGFRVVAPGAGRWRRFGDGKDALHRVRFMPAEVTEAVERVPTMLHARNYTVTAPSTKRESSGWIAGGVIRCSTCNQIDVWSEWFGGRCRSQRGVRRLGHGKATRP